VEVGLICIFKEPRILNEARVSSYIQAISRHEYFFFMEICNFGDQILVLRATGELFALCL